MKLFYPALISFDASTSTYAARVPDLGDCSVRAETLADAILSIENAAAESVLTICARGGCYPKPSELDSIVVDEPETFVNPIFFDLSEYLDAHPGETIRLELELPRWLLTRAEEYSLNPSRTLLDVLLHVFDDGNESADSIEDTFQPPPEGLNCNVRIAYPAKIYPARNGKAFLAEFPDLDNQTTFGTDIADALYMANDLASMLILGLIEEGKPLPEPSRFDEISVARAGGFVCMIAVDVASYAAKWSDQLIPIEVELPKWLAQYTERRCDLSKVLRLSLHELVNMKRDGEDEEEMPDEIAEKIFEALGIDPAEAMSETDAERRGD